MKKAIDALWTLRYEQRLEECILGLSGLRRELAERADEPWALLKILLLSGSLARARGDRGEFGRLLKEADLLARDCQLSGDYHLQFEHGLWHFTESDYVSALDRFSAASSASGDLERKVSALTNVLLCLENLLMPHQTVLAEIRGLLAHLAPSVAKGAREELRGFEIRTKFRGGNVKGLAHANADRKLFGTNDYLVLWAQQLPYHRAFLELPEREALRMNSAQFCHNKQYRLRTLIGVDHPHDQDTPKVSDITDRFYLWVWKWLVSGDQVQLDRVLRVRDLLERARASVALMPEEKVHLHVGLQWLHLFDRLNPESSRLISAAQLREFPIYEIESLAISYLVARRDRDPIEGDCLRALRTHPLWESKDIRFKDLLEALDGDDPKPPSGLAFLARQLRSVVLPTTPGDAELTVDPASNRVENVRTRLRIVSQPMTLAFQTLASRRSLGLGEFLAHCFGIRSFDPLIHNPKIFNLVARMNGVLASGHRIRVKDGQVFTEGSWQGVHVIKSAEMTRQLRSHSRWKGPQSERTEIRDETRTTSTIGVRIDLTQPVKRRQLEALIGKSRSTTHRLLSQWIKAKLVTREGGARSTRYRVDPSLGRRLFK